MKTLDHAVQLLMDSEIGQKILAKNEATKTAERKKHIDSIVALKARLLADAPGLDAKVEQAHQKVVEAERLLREAKENKSRIYCECLAQKQDLERQVQSHERSLAESADWMEIDKFKSELENELADTRDRGIQSIVSNEQSWTGQRLATSNSIAFKSKIRRLTEILSSELVALAYIANSELTEKIDELRESVPNEHQWDDPSIARRIERASEVAV